MPLRTTMSNLIARVRLLVNDPNPPPSGGVLTFQDTDIQDVLDESRMDLFNRPLKAMPTYSGSTISFLDYFSDLGGWEDGMTLRQYLTVVVTPSSIEPIAGHFQFAATTLPPVMVTGKLYDVYRAAADLLERWSAKMVFAYDITANGQTLHRSQQGAALQKLVAYYRRKQRARTISMIRTDLRTGTERSVSSTIMGNFNPPEMSLSPTELDYYAKG